MDHINVTDVQVIAALREVVAESPERVYEAPPTMPTLPGGTSCFYVHRTAEGAVPGCLVGHVLHRLGVPLSELEKWEGAGAQDPTLATLNILGDNDEYAVRMLVEVQSTQDNGAPWGTALSLADQ